MIYARFKISSLVFQSWAKTEKHCISYIEDELELATKYIHLIFYIFHLFVVGFCLCLYQSRKYTVEPKQVYDIYVVLIQNQPTLVVFPLIILSYPVPLLFPVVSFVLFEHEDDVFAVMSVVVVYAVVSICVSFACCCSLISAFKRTCR